MPASVFVSSKMLISFTTGEVLVIGVGFSVVPGGLVLKCLMPKTPPAKTGRLSAAQSQVRFGFAAAVGDS